MRTGALTAATSNPEQTSKISDILLHKKASESRNMHSSTGQSINGKFYRDNKTLGQGVENRSQIYF